MEYFDSDGQQFHQYQQNKQSPLTSTHWTYKRPRRWNPGPGLGLAQKCG
jgi:hypothetical protein